MTFHHGFAGIPTAFTVVVDEGTRIFPPTMTPITSLALPVVLAAEAGAPTGEALAALGMDLPTLPDLRPETVADYGALIVGAEAHEKNFAGLGRHPEQLLDFIHSGGRVALFQLQDTALRGNHLPYELQASNDGGAWGEITAPAHPHL